MTENYLIMYLIFVIKYELLLLVITKKWKGITANVPTNVVMPIGYNIITLIIMNTY